MPVAIKQGKQTDIILNGVRVLMKRQIESKKGKTEIKMDHGWKSTKASPRHVEY